MKPLLHKIILYGCCTALTALTAAPAQAQQTRLTRLLQRKALPPGPAIPPQIIYYPFYNGRQLVEIDLVSEWMKEGYPERAIPRAIDWEDLNPAPLNPVLVRDIAGAIIASYNTKEKDFSGYKLLPPGKLQGKTVWHRERLYRGEHKGVTTQTDSAGRYYIFEGNKKGAIDSFGRLLLAPEYDIIYMLGKAYYLVKEKNAVITSIDFASRQPVDFDELRHSGNGLFCVKKGKYYGLLNEYGTAITGMRYSGCPNRLSLGYGLLAVAVCDGGKCMMGAINRQGKEVAPPEYERIRSFGGGLVAVQLNGLWGGVDTTGKTVIPHIYEEVHHFIEGLAAAQLNGLWGFVDSTGQTVIPHMYNRFFFFKGGLASVQKMVNGQLRYGLINQRNETVFPFEYEEAYPFYSGRSLIKLNGKYGYMDSTGRVVIPCIYTQANLFSGNEARVRVGNKEYYIDTNGKWLRAGGSYD